MTTRTTLTWNDELTDEALNDVRDLLVAARAEDGRPDVVAGGPLPGEFVDGRHLLARQDADLVGYVHLDPAGDAFGRQVGELVVHPAHRRHGIGNALLTELVEVAAPGEADGERLRIWSHTDHPAAARLAARHGLRKVRELLRMRLDFADAAKEPLPEPRWADAVRVRTFVPGKDEHAVIEVNRRAFSWHPEQGALTTADLEQTEREDWFDQDGFFLATDENDHLLGFHWTKVHPDGVGEVYVVGVDPDAQGGGLGRALTLAGLHYLRGRGVDQVILYVEGDNAPAVAVYTRLGFRRWDAGVQYAR